MKKNNKAVASFRVELTHTELIEIRHILNHGLQRHERESRVAERNGHEGDMNYHDNECERFIDLGMAFYETQIEINKWDGFGWQHNAPRGCEVSKESEVSK